MRRLGTTGLYHTAIVYPTHAALATALHATGTNPSNIADRLETLNRFIAFLPLNVDKPKLPSRLALVAREAEHGLPWKSTRALTRSGNSAASLFPFSGTATTSSVPCTTSIGAEPSAHHSFRGVLASLARCAFATSKYQPSSQVCASLPGAKNIWRIAASFERARSPRSVW